MCWSGMSGRLRSCRSRENVDVRAVAEQQELEVVLPHQVAAAQRAVVRVEDLVERGVPVVLEHELVGLVLGQVRDAAGR